MSSSSTPALRPLPAFPEFVALVALMMGLTAFSVDNVLPALEPIRVEFGMADANAAQLVVFVYLLGFGIAQLGYGPLADIAGRRPAFLAGLVVYLGGCVLALVSSDLTTLLVARFIQGVRAASGRVVAIAIVRDRYVGREMARVMSFTSMVFITVPVLAPAIGGALLLAGPWRIIFASMLVCGMALGLWFIRRMPETLRPENRMPLTAARILDGIRLTVTNRVAFGYATAFGLLFACILGYVGSARQIFTELYNLADLFPLAFGLIACVMGVAAFVVNSQIVRRFGVRRVSHAALLAYLAVALGQVGLALVFKGHPPLLMFGGVLAANQFLSSLCMSNFNALAMEPLGSVAGTASAFIGAYTTVLGTVLGLAIGQAFDGTVLPLGTGYALMSVGAVAIVLWTERGRLFGR